MEFTMIRVVAMLTVVLCFFGKSTATTALQATDPELASRCFWTCHCYRVPRKGRSNVVVDCHHVTDFPSILPKDTTVVILQDSPIRRIADKSLVTADLKWLEVLECSGCQIAAIGPRAFHRVPKLKSINLSNNSITDLGPDHFSVQTHLILLDLTGNPSLDCDPLKRGLPRTRVLCDALKGPRPNGGEFPTSAATEYAIDTASAQDNATETASLPRDDYNITIYDITSPSTSTYESKAEGAISGGFYVGWVLASVVGAIALLSVALSVVFRRQILRQLRGRVVDAYADVRPQQLTIA